MKILTKHIIGIIAATLLIGCYNQGFLANQNRAGIYQQEGSLLQVEYLAEHLDDSISVIHFAIPQKNLLFEKSPTGKLEAALEVIVNIHTSYNSRAPFSSDTVIRQKIRYNQKDLLVEGKFYVPLKQGYKYLLEMIFVDQNREYEQSYLSFIEKNDAAKRSYYMGKKGQKLLYQPYISIGDSITVERNDQVSILWVKYYHREFDISSPPYAIFNQMPFDFMADEVFTYTTGNQMVFNQPGIYHFQSDTNKSWGYTVVCTREHYPEVSKVNHLYESLRYITTNKEFKSLYSANTDSLKRNVDEFWLNTASNTERAKELIRTYYGRVEMANKLFTSYQEGWRTDRGMIYTVFGAPNILYQNEFGETWVYGKEASPLSFTFNFSKVSNPFSDNDYQLNRSSMYRYSWGQAVDFWRQGRIFNSNAARQEQQYYERQEPFIWY